MLKKILIAVAAVLVIVVGGFFVLYSQLDSIIKAQIEKHGREATQAEVKVDDVKLSLTSGDGKITGVSVANPAGFSNARAFELGEITIKVDQSTIRQNPILIREVVIAAPKVLYERTSGGGNLEKLRDNVAQYRGASTQTADQRGTGSSSTSGSKPTGSEEPETKFIIEQLNIREGRVTITGTQLQGRTLTTNLPAIQLRDIGKDKGGATPAEITQRVLMALSEQSARAAATELQKSLGIGGGQLQVPQGTGDRLRGVLGGNR